jgi:hypothetical protein
MNRNERGFVLNIYIVKNILSFKLFEQVYLNDIKPFDNNNSHPKGLKFVNREEALKSVRRLQDMLNRKELQLKDAIIAAYIISHRAEFHKYPSQGIKDGLVVWKNFLGELRKREKSAETPAPKPPSTTTPTPATGATGSTGPQTPK